MLQSQEMEIFRGGIMLLRLELVTAKYRIGGWLKFERMGQHIFFNLTFFETKACQLTFAMDIILLVPLDLF